jgi:hypothetical protein
MPILAWVVYIGFSIEAGAIIISYIVSCVNPEAAKNLYKGLSLYDFRQYNFWGYTVSIVFLIALPVLKASVAYEVIKTLSKFNLKNPFTIEVAKRLEKISYIAFAVWIVTMLSNAYVSLMLKITGKSFGSLIPADFIFMVGLTFIIAQVFKRGVEIQSENDLTV